MNERVYHAVLKSLIEGSIVDFLNNPSSKAWSEAGIKGFYFTKVVSQEGDERTEFLLHKGKPVNRVI